MQNRSQQLKGLMLSDSQVQAGKFLPYRDSRVCKMEGQEGHSVKPTLPVTWVTNPAAWGWVSKLQFFWSVCNVLLFDCGKNKKRKRG